MKKKLSIIIPFFNCKKYTDELLDALNPQMRSDVEVVVVDDGSDVPFASDYSWCRVLRKENGGAATARNMGLDNSKGEYVQFIDADDLVPDYFVERLFKAFETDADMIDFSWRSLTSEGAQHSRILKAEDDRLTNPSVCTRCFKRSFIGDVRFNELKDSTEDEDFSRKLGFLDPDNTFKRTAITDFMYYYRTSVVNSKVKRFKAGLMNTKRVVYYYNQVTADMTWLLDEIREEDKKNEVWLLTNLNEIPDLKKYCQISKPMNIWGHYFRGEPYNNCTKIDPPLKTQVVMYCEFANVVGGISTFMYNWANLMKKYYDIVILYDAMDPRQAAKLNKAVPAIKNDLSRNIICDTIILNRLTDKMPPNVSYKKTVQMCHACGPLKNYHIPQDRDYIVNVSQVSKDSWEEQAADATVIHNMFYEEADELLIVSATRMQASDKGDNDKRIRRLAEMLNEAEIPFVWLNFSDKPLPDPPKNFINMDARLNIQSFIKRADYLCQLSNREAYSMSILEALSLETACICTPFPSLFEEGFVDGQTGYVVPFDMDFDVRKLLNVPRFSFSYDNKKLIKQWRKILDAPSKTIRYGTTEANVPAQIEETVKVRVVNSFRDVHTSKLVNMGDITLPRSRVEEILKTQAEKKIKLIEVL